MNTAGAQPGQAPPPEQGKRLCSLSCGMQDTVLAPQLSQHPTLSTELSSRAGTCTLPSWQWGLTAKVDARGAEVNHGKSCWAEPRETTQHRQQLPLTLPAPSMSHKGGLTEQIKHPLGSTVQRHTEQQTKNSWDRAAESSAQSILR